MNADIVIKCNQNGERGSLESFIPLDITLCLYIHTLHKVTHLTVCIQFYGNTLLNIGFSSSYNTIHYIILTVLSMTIVIKSPNTLSFSRKWTNSPFWGFEYVQLIHILSNSWMNQFCTSNTRYRVAI